MTPLGARPEPRRSWAASWCSCSTSCEAWGSAAHWYGAHAPRSRHTLDHGSRLPGVAFMVVVIWVVAVGQLEGVP